uniref:Uncharacterized protein n=1 Tax=Aegilops tauschii TaxID=37682 RepID=M8AQW8_AEGTA
MAARASPGGTACSAADATPRRAVRTSLLWRTTAAAAPRLGGATRAWPPREPPAQLLRFCSGPLLRSHSVKLHHLLPQH